jgi:prepilin-type N-terminal cleavage/methylation domain-containing protein
MIKKGFTLVELLIVIALLGAIAMVVIAAINPIEQANRARDTQFKSDGAQLISAIDRYFAANQEFPWVTVDDTLDNDGAFGFFTATDAKVGICAAAGCTGVGNDGVLITSNELQTAFRSRNFITSGVGAANDKKLFIGKAEGTSESVYACYIPMSKSNRDRAIADLKVYNIAGDGARTPVSNPDTACVNWVDSGCYVCIPE